MTSIERRDPRARLDWHPGPNARPRATLLKSVQDSKPPVEPQPVTRRQRLALPTVVAIIDAPKGRIREADSSLLDKAKGIARSHGGTVLVPAWSDVDCDKLVSSGADHVVQIAYPADACEREAMAQALDIINYRYTPTCVIFHEIGRSGDAGRRFAAQTGAQVTGGPYCIVPLHMVPSQSPSALTSTRGVELAVIEKITIDHTVTRYAETIDHPQSELALSEAQLVLAAGTGIQDWQSFHALARALNATIGATRAVCDAGLLARDRQIGASGQIVSPECYIALGISGAPQHVQGLRHCDHVIAINTDLHAAMIKRADLAIIADVQQVMPALLETLGTSQ